MSDVHLELTVGGTRATAAWMVGSFLVFFLLTRLVTRLIRAGRGPFANTVVAGVHLHHMVYGIFLMLIAGAGEFIYHPDAGWRTVLAVAFGAGAALTFDEFALWLHLSDVYWAREGRVSVETVMIVAVVGGLLVLGFDPIDPNSADSAPLLALGVAVNLGFAVVAALKGKVVAAIVGLLVPFVALVAAVRLARPRSPWARRFYRPGSVSDVRARGRYPIGRRTRWDALAEALGGTVRDRA